MSTQFDKTVFPKRLREIRQANEYKTQTKFADAIGISGQAVSYYESGKRLPDAETLYLLADFFKCSIDWLLGISDNMYPDNNYIQKVTGLNENAIEHLSSGCFNYKDYPSQNLILNTLLSDVYIDNLISTIQKTMESMIEVATIPQEKSASLLRRERDLQEMMKSGVSAERIELEKTILEYERNRERHLYEKNVDFAIEMYHYHFSKIMCDFLDETATALSKKYGEWLLNKKQAELSNIESTIKGATTRGINKA